MTAVAVWQVFLKPADLQIKNAALGEELSDQSGRTTVDEVDEESPEAELTTVLCSLTAGKIEQSACDLILESDEEYTFELIGKNTVYLYGNYIGKPQMSPTKMPTNHHYDSDMESDMSDEEGYDLDDVSSDVEIHPDELQGLEDDVDRFEELADLVEDEPKVEEPKASKRPRDEAMDTDEQPAEKLSKKKKAKKQKGEDGKAVPVVVEEKAAEPKGEKEQEKKADKKEKKKQKAAEEKKGGAAKELTGGVKIRDVKSGDGKTAKNGAKISMRYIGKLQNGKIFDQNTKGKPFTFKLGAGDVIKGWDVGVAGMQIGGEREIIVPPAMGYGAKKIADIPPNSTLIFEVKCLEIK
ncbi:uncharacterized protein EDB91DRAFT_1145394 [Suillus paluster]|uniref:uncharacterized protein n=1 Tax=Suillus paluster TaxID=48578 RepID=UPI001B8602AA|nr:uncharacterized protein EDB91DRAFT_1145394 [Suillus paluster]KAG1735124.1 hypothetical protein EDB91DRAFT_1145394 [Suillus paluster]